MTKPSRICAPYAARVFSSAPSSRHGGWRIKRYYVHLRGESLDVAVFRGAEALSRAELPAPARSAGRAGAAFTIGHQGRERNYFVLGWWDNENELPLRVWVRERNGANARWRPARGGESVCVWDLDIVWFERSMYVRHVMARHRAPDLRAYLRSVHTRAQELSACRTRRPATHHVPPRGSA